MTTSTPLIVSYYSTGDCASPCRLGRKFVDHDLTRLGVPHVSARSGFHIHTLVDLGVHLPYGPSVFARDGKQGA